MDKTMTNEDRRTAKRISYVCEVECEGAGLNRLATRINDLSMTGAFIDSLTCYAPGTHLRLRFRVQDVWIEAAAEVRYMMPQMGMGVRFLDLESCYLSALESLVDGKPVVRSEPNEQRDGSEHTPSSWTTPDRLLGHFSVVSMCDVIQLIENNRLSGALNVLSPVADGEIHFNDGRIAAAYSGPRTGTEALEGLLDVTSGSFEFRTSATQYPTNIQAPGSVSSVLEMLRMKDEEAGRRLEPQTLVM
jgi:hypothetical protein